MHDPEKKMWQQARVRILRKTNVCPYKTKKKAHNDEQQQQQQPKQHLL